MHNAEEHTPEGKHVMNEDAVIQYLLNLNSECDLFKEDSNDNTSIYLTWKIVMIKFMRISLIVEGVGQQFFHRDEHHEDIVTTLSDVKKILNRITWL